MGFKSAAAKMMRRGFGNSAETSYSPPTDEDLMHAFRNNHLGALQDLFTKNGLDFNQAHEIVTGFEVDGYDLKIRTNNPDIPEMSINVHHADTWAGADQRISNVLQEHIDTGRNAASPPKTGWTDRDSGPRPNDTNGWNTVPV